MIAFITEHRDIYGVEPICKVLPIAPSTYRLHAARQRDPSLLPDRTRRDLVLMEEIERVFETNYSVYGARKVWRQLRREGRDAARCTVERLMRDLGLAGAIRGKPVKTTVSDKGAACPLDRVNRQFQAPEPNRLWVADFTYVATWAGFVYVAFVIDAFARRIVGWRVSRTAHASFVLDALEQAIHARKSAARIRSRHRLLLLLLPCWTCPGLVESLLLTPGQPSRTGPGSGSRASSAAGSDYRTRRCI